MIGFAHAVVVGDVAVGLAGEDGGGLAEVALDVGEGAAGHEPQAGVAVAEVVDGILGMPAALRTRAPPRHGQRSGPPAPYSRSHTAS